MYVDIEYANDGQMGSIMLLNNATEQEICRRDTTKTEALQRIMIEQNEDIKIKRTKKLNAIITMQRYFKGLMTRKLVND